MAENISSDCGNLPMSSSPEEVYREALQELGLLFYEWGWSLGTSSNYSVRLSQDPFRLLVTASGKDKSQLADEDFVVVDEAGKPVADFPGKPSAETMIHVMLAQKPEIGSVLHTHSVWGTLLSEDPKGIGGVAIEGYEMLKGLAGVKTHEHREWVPIFENSQDIPSLAEQIKNYLENDEKAEETHGFLIRRHGLYTWGKDLMEAKRQVEIFEFLFEVMGRS